MKKEAANEQSSFLSRNTQLSLAIYLFAMSNLQLVTKIYIMVKFAIFLFFL